MNMKTRVRALALSASAVSLAAASGAVTAQETDARWAPWTGCWQASDDGSGLICLELADGGAELLSVGDEGVVSQETIVADGVPRSIEDETCSGTTTAEFSPDAERVYLREEIDCGADAPRVISGVIAMVSPSEWVDIRGAENGRGVFSRTFRRVSDEFATSKGFPDANNDDDLTARMRRWAVSEPSSFDDLLEVFDRTGPGVTQAWVISQNDPFPVDSDFVVALDEAGLPHDVIDVVVAHAFPAEFTVANDARTRRAASPQRRATAYVGVDPFLAGRAGFGAFWSPWSWRYRGFGWNGFGWNGWGFGPGGGFGFPFNDRIIVVQRGGDVPGVGARPGARPVPGGGYARDGRSWGGGDRAPVRMGGSSGGSRGAVSSGGSTGGGSRSTGRKAKPRTGGGGGSF